MRGVDRILLVLIAGTLAFNGYTFAKHSWLEPARTVLPPGEAPVVGTTPPALPVTRISDKSPVEISSGPEPTLLYFISPTCRWCQANEKSIVELWKQLHTRYRFVGVSFTKNGLEDFLRAYPLPFEVFLGNDLEPAIIDAYGLGATPNLILLSKDGKIEKVWAGALRGEHKKSVEAYFKVAIPSA